MKIKNRICSSIFLALQCMRGGSEKKSHVINLQFCLPPRNRPSCLIPTSLAIVTLRSSNCILKESCALTFTHFLNARNKVVIAKHTKTHEKVATDDCMDGHCPCLPLLWGEQVWWEIFYCRRSAVLSST